MFGVVSTTTTFKQSNEVPLFHLACLGGMLEFRQQASSAVNYPCVLALFWLEYGFDFIFDYVAEQWFGVKSMEVRRLHSAAYVVEYFNT